MNDRFEFEKKIMACWNVVDDIKTLRRQYMDLGTDMTKDQVDNYLLGLETIYQVKFNQLFDQFEAMIRERKIT